MFNGDGNSVPFHITALCFGDSMNSVKWKEDIKAELRETFQLAVHSAERKVLDHLPFTLRWCLAFQSESESESSSENNNKKTRNQTKKS